ncbi:UDP-N-acetylmuramoyl-L-alanyl-D-glutamate--2,6-diaminopimelate ligase [Campylobacter sp. RM16187]|uniref:UDP-N-acetylmuramoyl-L-alanyl-D-glutamate--2, 6-diaminopimelate ligase n=1 Tax=Campylobacter sp. RM16187 TaxID=1660063 RepID=UPI0021B4E778|nr:UDP-N-acetylmuramoyl-L-alanyl-D-glutamate--2,6-diaminopimelate ligase [Campylobacter sp. RM16187]QKG28358.1 UDP-N-acetylmuramoylalanyl-D-glutamate 2,6-diaminopimelate ligase [Campylobacter sp. RM16187]
MKIYTKDSFITDNSKECEKGCFFVRTHTNSKFIDLAIANGAKVISLSECKEILGIDKNIKIIGITGTNGKTTTAAAIYSLLLDLGYKCGLCGTRGAFVNDKRIDEKALTTSEILRTINYLKVASEEKCEFFVMEVSSHAIDQNRIESLDFAMKIFTNLTQDHLDYHHTFEEYARVKSSFFDDDTLKLINIDDGNLKFNVKNALTYSLKKHANFTPIAYGLKNGINAIVKTPKGELEIGSNLQGEFNLYNLIAAIGCVMSLTDKSCNEISRAVSNFGGVEGRMEVVSDNPLVIVDFAHTPDGIEKVLNALCHYEIVAIFGAGGDRDNTKRPKMGAMVQRFAKLAIVTSDNPRSEEPMEIIKQICAGMKMDDSVICEPDRKKAIKIGLESLKGGQILVILGKGDESYQEIKGIKYPFSDKDVVLQTLSR